MYEFFVSVVLSVLLALLALAVLLAGITIALLLGLMLLDIWVYNDEMWRKK